MRFTLFDWYYIARVFSEENSFEYLMVENEDGLYESLYPKRSTWRDAFIDLMDQVEPCLSEKRIDELDKDCGVDYVLRGEVRQLNYSECRDLAVKVGLLVRGTVRRDVITVDETPVVEAYKRKMPTIIYKPKPTIH